MSESISDTGNMSLVVKLSRSNIIGNTLSCLLLYALRS